MSESHPSRRATVTRALTSLLLAFCLALSCQSSPARAEIIDLDAKHMDAQDLAISSSGFFEGFIMNISEKPLAGVTATVAMLGEDNAPLFSHPFPLPALAPGQKHPVRIFYGLDRPKPRQYVITYKLDTSRGKNPDEKVSTVRRQLGFTQSGSGLMQTREVEFEAGEKEFILEYKGNDEIVIRLLDLANTYSEILFEEEGPVNATKKLVVNKAGPYKFDIDATGDWTLRVRDPQLQKEGPASQAAPGNQTGPGKQPAPGAASPAAPATRNQLRLE